MKRCLIAALALALAACLLLCGAAEEAQAFLGEWHFVEAVFDGDPVTAEQLGMEAVITLNDDAEHTARVDYLFAGEASGIDGTWAVEGDTLTLTMGNGGVDVFVLTDGKLVETDADRGTLTFARAEAEPGA